MDFVGIDADDRDVFIDWKTRNTLGRTTLAYYPDSMPIQLVAYLKGYEHMMAQKWLFVNNPRIISVLISRDEPGRVEHHEWPSENIGVYWKAFKALLDWWKYEKDYDPSFEIAPD